MEKKCSVFVARVDKFKLLEECLLACFSNRKFGLISEHFIALGDSQGGTQSTAQHI